MEGGERLVGVSIEESPGQGGELGNLGFDLSPTRIGRHPIRWSPASPLVDRDPRRDREDPRTEMTRVPELGIAPERPQKGLLEGVLGSLAPDQPHQVTPDLIARLRVQALEGWDRHGFHHQV